MFMLYSFHFCYSHSEKYTTNLFFTERGKSEELSGKDSLNQVGPHHKTGELPHS